jgi:hypothetical protein
MKRPISFEQAKAQYTHRFTMEHVPVWAILRAPNGKYYAPQYRSDKEWYDNTLFAGESELATKEACYTANQSWPLGQWLDQPYQKGE